MNEAPEIVDEKDIPRFVRRCYEEYRAATKDVRESSIQSLKMWVGGKLQWRESEIASRTAANRPIVTINRLRPAVDQVENEARSNPPGPQAHPVGDGADKDGADILEGLIREYEYRSYAQGAYVTSLRYAAAGNAGVFELGTEYEEGSMAQRLVVKEIEDPAMVFSDHRARRASREDAMWGGKIRVLSREQVIADYGNKLKILNRGLVERAQGWMQDAMGFAGNQVSVNEWTGGSRGDGPYYICEFYQVKIKREKLVLYSDNILRHESDSIPEGVTPKVDSEGAEISRSEPVRTVKKYVVTALDILDETDWPGTTPPFFWVLGPEIYINGKLYRLSLIDGGIDSQRGLNYTATSCAEVVGSMTKSPWVGWLGQFDSPNAQGINPWDAPGQVFAYMEVKPTFAVNPTTKESELLPAPTRNSWEAPIARLLELATFFGEQIKASTSVFFDPSVQSARDAQSGEAIKALQSQTNIGTINWQDQLHRAVSCSYGQAAIILAKIMDGPRVKTIVRADTNHEQVEINREFPGDPAKGIAPGIDPATGKKGKTNSIILGRYSLRVTAGPNQQTRTEESIEALTEVFKIAPQLLAAPGVAAQFLRMVGEGSPQVEQMADALSPSSQDDQSPQQLGQKVTALQQQNQQLMQVAQQLHQAIVSKLPEQETKKYIARLNALAGIREAEIKAGVDLAGIDADKLEHLTGLAHDAATQAVDHQHEAGMQQRDQAAAQTAQASDQAHATASQQSELEAAAEPAPANGD